MPSEVKDVQSAIGILTYNPRYASSVIFEIIKFQQLLTLKTTTIWMLVKLYIAECYANAAPTMKKKLKPRAQG